MPTLPPYIIEPIWRQFEALLPERETGHPLGCHRRRIPDRIVFEKLVQILVFGCAYERIAGGACSESTLRRRRGEWVELGVMERLRRIALDAYDRLIGLRLTNLAVDCCMTKAPCGGEKAGRVARWTGEKGGSSAPRWWTARASRSKPSAPLPTATTRHCWARPSTPWGRWGRRQKGRGCIWTAPTPRPLPAASWRPVGWQGRSQRRASRLPCKPECGGSWRGRTRGITLTRSEALVWCTERHGRVIGFWVAFSEVIIVVRRLIREGWSRYRWEGRPSRRP